MFLNKCLTSTCLAKTTTKHIQSTLVFVNLSLLFSGQTELFPHQQQTFFFARVPLKAFLVEQNENPNMPNEKSIQSPTSSTIVLTSQVSREVREGRGGREGERVKGGRRRNCK